ncbi:hypothetical protein NKR23_g10949 [Pleurostoma richardsiae]|uniref:Uncharacterized protein n=1 Tax=Pleurostoma richardsiae TaxID=41990 RepID=A0AA38R4F1_9PEZI|nr:hypothetical protein NKR23_g10949 [Pleurostoma richardsiae]
MMKKPRKNSAKFLAEWIAEEDDTRPQSSLYAASIIKLHLKDGTEFTIPRPLLQKCPKLQSPASWIASLRLEATEEVGHVLVHFLHTETYQCLRPKGTSPTEKIAAEFTTSLRVYALARDYELPALADLAQLEIERLGKGLPFSIVLGLIQSAYPDPSADDVWFGSYLKSGLKSVFQKPSEFLDCGVQDVERKTLSVSDFLVKGLAELVRDHVILPEDLDAAPKASPVESEQALPEICELQPNGLSPEVKAVSMFDAEPEPEKKDETFWASFGPAKKGKKNKSTLFEHRPAADPKLTPAPEPAPAPEMMEEDDWSAFSVPKKSKKKKRMAFEPQLGMEPEKKDENDPWAGWGTLKKDKKKKNKTKKKGWAIEPEPHLESHDVDPSSRTTSPPQVPDSGAEPVKEAAQQEEDKAAPAVIDDWTLCTLDSEESKPQTSCESRAEHVLGNGWKGCHSCRDFVRQMSLQLAREES